MANEDKRSTRAKVEDVLASVDEKQLEELGEADAYGGTTVPCGVAVSVALCPTTKCTSKC
ncbi:class II lanthipeptide, LchA2/BrtA2 family [Nocardiopsis dassonvillei]|uniref:class II lanthipeptide, LchA2/BrtA2 family n=1 Tax=Nocardiopsis dassonvillei TaxID=2014 RepID=UPI0033F38A80